VIVLSSNNFDSHKTYKKVGKCNRCGRCCDLHCPAFKFVALRDIRKGESFLPGINEGAIKAVCLVFNANKTVHSCTLEQRKGFPFAPTQTPPKCGYTWVEE